MIGERQRAEVLNWLLGKVPATSAMSSGSLYLDLYLTDPGDDGQGASAVTGGSYGPAATTSATWGAATYGDPTIAPNASLISWPMASGNWASGGTIRYVGAWKHASDRTEANFVGRFRLVTPRTVLTGQTFTFPVGTLQFRLSSGGAVSLQEGYDIGGNVDAVVDGEANLLRVRAEDNTADVLLRFRRNETGVEAEQTLVKAPDAVDVTVAGTSLYLDAGAGVSGTGSTNGSAAGAISLRGKTGGSAVNGEAGQGTSISIVAGDAGDVSGATGVSAGGGTVEIIGAKGSDSSNAAVDGGEGGGVYIDAGPPGTGTGGEGGSEDGSRGTVDLGTVNAGEVNLGNSNALATLLGITIRRGVSTPVGFVDGTPGDYYLRQSTGGTDNGLWQHRGPVANNTSWVRVLDTATGIPATGGVLSGPLDVTPTAVAFSATPTLNVAANDVFAFSGALTGNITNLTLSNPAVGKSGKVYYVQDGTGGRLIQAITCAGFTLLMHNATNINADTTASKRFLLTYDMVSIGGTQVCIINVSPATAIAYS